MDSVPFNHVLSGKGQAYPELRFLPQRMPSAQPARMNRVAAASASPPFRKKGYAMLSINDATELTKSCILLFHAVPEVEVSIAPSPKDDEAEILWGYRITADAWACNPLLARLSAFLKKNVGCDLRALNAGFHKSFAAVHKADAAHLFAQQILHYFSTYGLEAVGLPAQAVIPAERLSLEQKEPVRIAILRRMPREEMESRLFTLAMGRAPVHELARPHLVSMLRILGLAQSWDISACKNKEMKMLLWDLCGGCPQKGEEFLRFLIYKATGSYLLIKSQDAIRALAEGIGQVKEDYFSLHPSLVPECASIFYRYKPLFLALRKNPLYRAPVNRMRRLAYALKKPARPQLLDQITCGKATDLDAIRAELKKISTGKKVALLNAIRRRKAGAGHAAYAIRNGRLWVGEQPACAPVSAEIEDACMQALIADLRPRVEGKSVLLPENPDYAFPASAKQFTGPFPFNTVYRLPKAVICGVHWENVLVNGREQRTDLDLHLNSATVNYGWNTQWDEENDALRREAKVVFSGDMTDAPRKKGGASEVYYIGEGMRGEMLLLDLNNFTRNGPCPFRLLLEGAGEDAVTRKSLLSRSLELAIPMSIEGYALTLGMLDCGADGGKRFIFASGVMGRGIVSSFSETGSGYIEHARASAATCLRLRDVLALAGARINEKDADADWDFDFSLSAVSAADFLRLLEDAPQQA